MLRRHASSMLDCHVTERIYYRLTLLKAMKSGLLLFDMSEEIQSNLDSTLTLIFDPRGGSRTIL